MANSEDIGLLEVGVLILGSPESLRNPDLQSIHPNVRFSPPVYLPNDSRPGIRQLFLEFLLNGRFLTVGERGCSQGHINIRTEILSSSQSWTLVLEDDVGLPLDWFRRVRDVLPGFPHAAAPGVILLNTNPYFDLGAGLIKLGLLPSMTNAFFIHKDSMRERSFTELEYFERADWPISFSNLAFWSISGIAFELPTESRIGPRRKRRVSFFLFTFVRTILSPAISLVLRLPLGTYLAWSVIGPLRRDVALKLRALVTRLTDSRNS